MNKLVSPPKKRIVYLIFSENSENADAQVEGGGNCGNVMVGLSRLGVVARPLAKLGTDAWGSLIVKQLKDEGVDTRSLIIKPG